MTDKAPQPDPDALAAALAAAFPGQRDARLAVRLLRLLAKGAPVSPHDLAKVTGDCADDVAQRLARWPSVEFDAAGNVVAFIGLSLRPTTHRFAVGDQTLFTWCAVDTLFLPGLLDRTARVHSACAETAQPISLTVTPRGVLDVQPINAVVSIVVPSTGGDIRSTFCCKVTFLASRNAGRAWLAERPGGALLSVDDAYELGRGINKRFFSAPDPLRQEATP